jgi:hypothetical protein
MKRILISLLAGTAVTFGIPTIAALAIYRNAEAVVPMLMFWPWILTDKLGLGPNCGNAEDIADKLSCARNALLIDLVSYPLLTCACSYVIYVMLFRRRDRMLSMPAG